MTTPTTVQVKLQIRADTAANWTAVNPVLLANEIGLESDTKKIKINTTGSSQSWNALSYFPFVVSGGTVLDNLTIGSTGTLSFEGSTDDGFETTLAVTNPTADRTITLPNQSGTVIVSGNASIVDADIAANAEIAVSKLADGAARQLLQTDAAGTGVEWASNIDIPGTLDVTGIATFDNAVTIAGDLTVNGTTTNINTQNLVVEDKNIIIADVATPTDVTADGGGITLKGASDKTISWIDATDAWTSSERFSVPLGSASAPSLTFTGDNNTGIYSPGADQVAISTGGSGRLFVDASGRVSVGVASPSYPFHIANGAIGVTSFSNSIDGAGEVGLLLRGQNGSHNTSLLFSSSNTNFRTRQYFNVADGSLKWDTSSDGTTFSERLRITSTGALNFTGAGTAGVTQAVSFNGSAPVNSLVIDSSGRLGVGTSVPTELLTVAGNIRLGASASSTDGAATIYSSGNNIHIEAHAGNNVGTKRNINLAPFGGSVGIGTTPDSRLHVEASGNALRIGYNPGTNNFNIYDATQHLFRNNGGSSEYGRWDSSGRLLVGTSSARGWSGITPQFQLEGLDVNSASASFTANINSANGSFLSFIKSRGTALNSNTLVSSGDILGAVYFNGADGTGPVQAAVISAQVDGTPGANDMPGRLVFSTTADGASSPTERMRT